MGRSVLMIGLDAADADIVERLAALGHLPNLKHLRDHGAYGRLSSPADLYAGAVWPTFYTGQSVPGHGIYHSKLWHATRMRVEVASDAWLSPRPFWESLGDARVCIIDVPMVLGPPRPLNGVYLGGWGTHDLLASGSWPRDLWQQCERRFGRPVMPPEHFGRQTERSLAELPDALVAATRQVGAIATDLLRREPYDLSCVVFGAAHRAGHYLWDRSQVGVRPGSRTDDALPPGLVRVYHEIDRMIGRLLDRIPGSPLVLAFAVHGMGPNPGWSDLLPDILARLQRHRSGAAPRQGALFRVKRSIPFHWARPVLQRLPASVSHGLVSVWSQRMYDWPSTRYFPLPMDEAGYIRLNVRGRERDGIVEAGTEYEALCDELSVLLLGLRDADTGAPIVQRVVRAFDAASPRAPARSLLPDLVATWTGPPAAQSRALTSATEPGFAYTVPPVLPSGRSGNHTDAAWFVAHGAGAGVGEVRGTYDVVDLVPTALHHLGVPVPPSLEGTAIDLHPSHDPQYR